MVKARSAAGEVVDIDLVFHSLRSADVAALRAAVLDAVKGTKDYDGVLGKWSFDADGDTSLTEMSGLIVKGGEFVTETVIK